MNKVEVFPWNENFETGIIEIDAQHQCLVELLNLLASHLAHRSNSLTLNNIFNQLADYASYHFASEERIWQEYFAEDEAGKSHKQDHQYFINEVMRLKAEEHCKPLDTVIEDILSFLTHWLAFHILVNDKEMAKIVLAIQSGLTFKEARLQTDLQMSGAMRVLIETILLMYDSLSTRTLQLMREINERQKAESKLHLAGNVFDNTLDAICITDADFAIIDANPSFYSVTDSLDDELMNKNLCLLKSGLIEQKRTDVFWTELHQSGHWSGIINNRRKSGELEAEWLTLSSVKDEQGLISHYVAVFSNVSHLIQQQARLEKIAHHDALTGLPNRLLLSDRLKRAIVYAERTQTSLAICYLDLDGFKPVNDQFGHAAGDSLLKEIAERFLKTLRCNDTVLRLGGDEFVILIGDLKNDLDCLNLLDRVLDEVGQPVLIGESIAQVSASIGVVFFPAHQSEPEILLHYADQAMYEAKKQGKSRYCVYPV